MEKFGYCCRCGLCCGTCEYLEKVGEIGKPWGGFCMVYDKRHEVGRTSCIEYPYDSLDVEERKDICTYFFK